VDLIDMYDWARTATHEHVERMRGVAAADDWADRVSHLVRGPGWISELTG
jgi:hypothetical protein